MSSDQCRITTKAGTRCQRPAQHLGFCWQHMPADKSDKDTWKRQIIDGAAKTALDIVAKLMAKIVELAVENVVEMFGEGDPKQSDAQHELMHRLPARYPELPSQYQPRTRTFDWVGLREIVHIVDQMARDQGRHLEGVQVVESLFDQWVTAMDPCHRSLLLESIEQYVE